MDATVRGTRLYYEQIGTGPPMLMMHGGLGMDHTLLRKHDALGERVQLIYYDHRGHGRSDLEQAGQFEISTLHDDAAALLDHLSLERAVIYGHSYGAWLALGFALRYPERTAALVMCGGAAAFDYVDLIMTSAHQRDPLVAARFGAVLGTTPTSDAEFRDMWPGILPLYFHDYDDRQLEVFSGIRYSAKSYATGMKHLATLNMLDGLEGLKCPTLLLVGDDDFITPASQSRRIAAKARDAEVIEIADCGHFPFIEKPVEYFSALENWLERRVSR